MPRKKKDGRFINYYIDRTTFERLERYADDKGQQMTTAIELILQEHLDKYESELAEKGGITMYCPNCNVLSDSPRCPICSKSLRRPLAEDYCYLTEKETIWAAAFADILTDHQIPFVTKNTLGAGLAAKMGPALERTRFYIPYANYNQAKLLEKELFATEFTE